ncbi:hypothetical protein EB796_011408 [Bugula neritina]|uniref:Uncharacterized protein n=1 Tax=Bugula neritina TaxID=10212 RepID=A0A7J7JY76_BUGNE|nr:hypothetical protein EB796_011408 [Bugula neritina]
MFHSPGSPLSPEEADNIKECVNRLRSAREETASTAPGMIRLSEDDNLSECSDVEEEGYADFTKDDLEPFISKVEGMQLNPTNSERVKQKFGNHQQTTPTVSDVCSISHVHMQQTQTCHIS